MSDCNDCGASHRVYRRSLPESKSMEMGHVFTNTPVLKSMERVASPPLYFQNFKANKTKLVSPLFLPKFKCPMHFHQAARDGQAEIVSQHINAIGKDKKKLNRKDQDQTTALHYAVRYGHFNIVKMLVENGANVNIAGEYGATPLHYAARYTIKPTKTPNATPFHTPHGSPLVKTKKSLRKMIQQKRFNTKRDSTVVPPSTSSGKSRFSQTTKGLRQFIDLRRSLAKTPPPPTDIDMSLRSRRGTRHGSLEDIMILKKDKLAGNQTKSSVDFNSENKETTFTSPDLEKDGTGSFEYGYAKNEEEAGLEKPVVIIGDLSEQDTADVKNIDALIIPAVRNVSTPSLDNISISPSLRPISEGSFFTDDEEESKYKDDISERGYTSSNENIKRASVSERGYSSSNENIKRASSTPSISEKVRKKGAKLLNVPSSQMIPVLPEEMILSYLIDQRANVNAKDFYGSTPLHYAALRGNVTAVRFLLQQKNIDIEAVDRTKMTALHAAASNGSYNVCQLLLNSGSNIRCFDEEDMTPLHFASMEGHYGIVELLLNHGEQNGGIIMIAKMIMDHDRDDQTALHLAVENGHTDIAKLCIEKGANVNFVKANLITPLHLACTSGQIDIVDLLVNSDADIEAKNVLQETPLHRAALFNRVKIVEYLLNKGAEINCRDKDKETPLMMSVRKDNVETVRLLLERRGDITVKDANDKTCLYVAAEEDSVDVFKVLREHVKVESLLEEFDKNENTPLHIAAMKGHNNIVEMLLEMGACIDSKNDQNLTPLHLAAKHGRSMIVKMLLTQDRNIANDEDDASNTPLHLAALEGHVKVVEILLECGAPVDARNAQLWTPLDCAASRGCTWCAECLLDADSPIDPTDKTKVTPLHLASKGGHVEMISLLLSRKADIARKDNVGRNCLDHAIEQNQRNAALEILSNEHWKKPLRNCTIEGNKILTPMRKLIKKLPDVAEVVFDKCIKRSSLPKEHPKYEMICNYEFLEDTFTDWGPGVYDYREIPSPQFNYYSYGKNTVKKRSLFSKIGEKLSLPGYARKHSEIKENHPLKFMVKNERTNLLCHPLVTCLLGHKWRRFGRYVYYSKLLLYIIYLIFVTGYALTVVSEEYEFKCGLHSHDMAECLCVPIQNSSYNIMPSDLSRKFFIDFGKYALLILALISVFIELAKIMSEWHHYFRIHSALELSSYVLAIIYALGSFTDSDDQHIEIIQYSRCTSWFRSLGAVTVWLSWISLVLFLRKFPKLGIYVVMFTHILKTFAQFFTVFALFIVAFGLGFHMLLYEQVEPHAFSTPARAILKTTMGMLGEFEYDTVFNDNYNPMTMAWAIYVAYLVINCIILMNLLVGLAVDDIKGVQEQAALKRLGMQVDLALDVEKALPISFQRKVIKMEESILPNAKKPWSVWSFWSLKSPASIRDKSDESEQITKEQNEMKDNMRMLKQKVKVLESQNNRLETMLVALLKHHEIEVDADEA